MIVGGRHVGIPVENMEQAKAFYVGLLGFQVQVDEIEQGRFIDTISGFPDVRVHIIKATCAGGWMVELLHYLSHPGVPRANPLIRDVGCAHIALTVDDVEQEYARLRDCKVPFNSPPQVSPSGKAKVCFCQDPDGNYVELVEVLK